MIYKRHYIQYNDLVFDEVDMVDEDDYSVSFKTFDSEYGFTHGSYAPYKHRGSLIKASSVSMTLTLRMKKLPCSVRPFYRRFVLAQLQEQGKLWAVQDNTLIWAYAYLKGYSESQSVKRDTIEIDIDFALPEGVWHKADKLTTFLVPYDVCDFMDCYEFKDINPCGGDDGNCCDCGTNVETDFCECCDCWQVTKDMALCYHTDDLQKVYDCYGGGFRVVVDCAKGEEFFFNSFYGSTHFGTKLCSSNGYIAGKVYSDTDIPTRGITIMLHGHVKDPYIEINGNGNVIKGEYDGVLTIYPDGTVTSGSDNCVSTLSVDKWVIPQGMDYGWEIHQGNNRVIIELGDCCQTACAYIMVDSLTI